MAGFVCAPFYFIRMKIKGLLQRFILSGGFNIMLLLSGWFTLNPQSLKAQSSEVLKPLIDRIVTDYCKDKYTQAIAVGIIDDTCHYQYFYGQILPTHHTPANGNTVFHIGSLSKIITTALLAQLEAAGVLQKTDTINQYLPDSVAANPALKNITLLQLATHTSGLPKEPGNIAQTLTNPNNAYENYTLTDLYAYLKTYTPSKNTANDNKWYKNKRRKNQPANQFKYSHLGIGLLGQLLQNATGQTYNELLKQYLLQPFAMQFTFVNPNLNLEQTGQLAPGFSFTGKQQPPFFYGTVVGAEAARSCLNDLMQFIQAYMPASNNNSHVNKALQTTLKPHYLTAMPHVWVAEGWYVLDDGRKTTPPIITHSGRTAGYSNYIAFIPDRKIGVIVLSNTATRMDELGINILELMSR